MENTPFSLAFLAAKKIRLLFPGRKYFACTNLYILYISHFWGILFPYTGWSAPITPTENAALAQGIRAEGNLVANFQIK